MTMHTLKVKVYIPTFPFEIDFMYCRYHHNAELDSIQFIHASNKPQKFILLSILEVLSMFVINEYYNLENPLKFSYSLSFNKLTKLLIV